MAVNQSYADFILDQLSGLGDFQTKRMFGGLALLKEGKAFAKIKHDTVWLKVNDANRQDFEGRGMPQYTYGKDNSRKLNFYEAPIEIIEDRDELVKWCETSMTVAASG